MSRDDIYDNNDLNDVNQATSTDNGVVDSSSKEFLQDKTDTSFASLRFTPGSIVPIDITDELKKDYLDYAMSVIMARALPDVRDGLKPSQRRILVAMKDLQLWPEKSYKKSAKIVGETIGNYHPHGDQAAYTTLVHMAQDFSFRYPLIKGQGNFGSIDGDPPAQMRYTEAKMEKITTELLRGLDKGLVTFVPNYDGSKLEPTVLPAHFPNLFANGAEGIAVGMATKIPPHNLGELIDALIAIIDAGNKWKGIALYNFLRKLKEVSNKRPYLYNQHPESEFENYIAPDDERKNEKLKLLQLMFEEGKLDSKAFKNLFGENAYQQLLGFINSPTIEGADYIRLQDITLYPKISTDLAVKDLMRYVKGPDFPTHGVIYNKKDILKLYETGKGKILVRGVAKVEENKRGKQYILITEIPYQVNKAVLVQSIAKLVQLKKVKGIKDIRDESNKEGIRIVLELKGNANPQIILQKLYKYTPLQLNYHANMIALVDKQPVTLNLKRYLELYLEFRTRLQIRELEFELAEAKYRSHILEGLLKAIDIIDEIIATIRVSKTQEVAKVNLINKFDFTELQAQAILDMPLKRLAALERLKLEKEYKELAQLITHHEHYLEDTTKVLELIKEDLVRIKEKYADKRRTKIVVGAVDEPTEDELINKEKVVVVVTKKGYIKRSPYESYRAQRRGGVGTKGARLAEGDFIKHTIVCDTTDYLLVFTDDGKAYKLRVYDIPEASRSARGTHIANLLSVGADTLISEVVRLPENITDKMYLVFLTKSGLIKKTHLKEYVNINRNGIRAIRLKGGDKLADVKPVTAGSEVLITSARGQGIRFNIDSIRTMGRIAAGVRGIRLKKDDNAVALAIINKENSMLVTVTESGYLKVSPVTQIRIQKRGGSGLRIHKVDLKRGRVVTAIVISSYNKKSVSPEVVITTEHGNIIKTTLQNVPIQSRTASGVKVIKVAPGDKVVSFSISYN